MKIDIFNKEEIKNLKESNKKAVQQYELVVKQNQSLQQENLQLRNVIKEFCKQFTKRHGNHFPLVNQLEKAVK